MFMVADRSLHMPNPRLVDNNFAIDWEAEAKHATQMFSRSVHCSLGQIGLAERRLETGMPLVREFRG